MKDCCEVCQLVFCKLTQILFCTLRNSNEVAVFCASQSLKEDNEYVKIDGDNGNLSQFLPEPPQEEVEIVTRTL